MAEPAAGAEAPDPIAEAHAELRADEGLQFDFPVRVEPETPAWLESLIEFLSNLGPVFRVLFWISAALAVAAILYAIARAVIARRKGEGAEGEASAGREATWRPTATQARTLLGDADRLASEGKFAQAVHLLLYRSIDDIVGWRPQLVRPALTSRDIGALDALPGGARGAFHRIAETVERSFFGGREVDATDFQECRRAYEAFALPGAAAR
jgi:hypothetical protein